MIKSNSFSAITKIWSTRSLWTANPQISMSRDRGGLYFLCDRDTEVVGADLSIGDFPPFQTEALGRIIV